MAEVYKPHIIIPEPPKPEEISPEKEPEKHLPGMTRAGIPIPILEFFGVYSPNNLSGMEERHLIGMLDDFHSQKMTPEDILTKLYEIEARIKKPPLGVSRINHLYNYLQITKKANQFALQQTILENQ